MILCFGFRDNYTQREYLEFLVWDLLAKEQVLPTFYFILFFNLLFQGGVSSS